MESASVSLENKGEGHQGFYSNSYDGHHSHAINQKDPEIPPEEDPDEASTDLSWHPRIQRQWWMIRGKFRSYRRALFPKLTIDEREARTWEQGERRSNGICRREALKYIKVINLAMQRIGEDVTSCYSTDLVSWRMIARDPAFKKIYLALDVENVPSYLMLSRLNKDPRWIDGIEQAIGVPVSWEIGKVGAILTIYRPVEQHPKVHRVTVDELLEDSENI
jgi:hypothetical protein